MTTTALGAAGRTGSAVVRRLLDSGQAVRVLVRDPGKARRLFGDAPRLEVAQARLGDPTAVAAGLQGADTVVVALGSIGLEANEAMDWAALGHSLLAAGDPAGARQAWDTALIILDDRLPLVSSIRDRLARLNPPLPAESPAPSDPRDLLPVPASTPA